MLKAAALPACRPAIKALPCPRALPPRRQATHHEGQVLGGQRQRHSARHQAGAQVGGHLGEGGGGGRARDGDQCSQWAVHGGGRQCVGREAGEVGSLRRRQVQGGGRLAGQHAACGGQWARGRVASRAPALHSALPAVCRAECRLQSKEIPPTPPPHPATPTPSPQDPHHPCRAMPQDPEPPTRPPTCTAAAKARMGSAAAAMAADAPSVAATPTAGIALSSRPAVVPMAAVEAGVGSKSHVMDVASHRV